MNVEILLRIYGELLMYECNAGEGGLRCGKRFESEHGTGGGVLHVEILYFMSLISCCFRKCKIFEIHRHLHI